MASKVMEGGAMGSGMDSRSSQSELELDDTKSRFIDQKVLEYVLTQAREAEILSRLRKETETLPSSIMLTTKDIGQLLAMLVQLIGAKRGIEVGVYTGYSALSVLLVMPSDAKLVACDVNEYTMSIARRYFDEASVSDKVDIRMGDATKTLQSLLDNGEENSYDYAFVDADKENYLNYYELLLKLVRPGGVIAVDNVLWFGRVVDPTVEDKQTVAIRHFNEHVRTDSRVSHCMLTASDGITLLMKRRQEE